MIRTTLMAGLLDTLGINTSHEMPQQIFEVGHGSWLDPGAETGARERRLAAAAATGPRVDYSQIRAVCEALLAELGWAIRTVPDALPCFIEGRGARVLACPLDAEGETGEELRVGLAGEIHPQVLENYKLVQPTAVFELDLQLLMG